MSSQPDEFQQVRNLLSLKRHEQPPPGYFDYFSDRLIARLEADEFSEYSSWWQWLVDKFDAKPVVACLYGVFVSGLLLTGFRLSQIFEAEATVGPVLPWLATTPASAAIAPGDVGQSAWLDSAVVPASLSGSMSPLIKSETPNLLFGGSNLRFQTLSFSPGN